VIDLAAPVPFVSDHVAVGDGPEGVAFSAAGVYAAVTILQGSYDAPRTAWFRHDTGAVSLLSLTGDKVSVVNSVAVGAFPEGIAFATDNVHLYVGNFHSNSISVLKIDGSTGRLIDTGRTITLPGPPASLRIGSQ
jgi:DNA-binding beta-propeller fold protein YncE